LVSIKGTKKEQEEQEVQQMRQHHFSTWVHSFYFPFWSFVAVSSNGKDYNSGAYEENNNEF